MPSAWKWEIDPKFRVAVLLNGKQSKDSNLPGFKTTISNPIKAILNNITAKHASHTNTTIANRSELKTYQ